MKIIAIMMQSHVIYAVILKKNRIYSAGYKSKKKQTRGAFNHSKVRPCLWFYDAISLLYTNFQFHINAYGDL